MSKEQPTEVSHYFDWDFPGVGTFTTDPKHKGRLMRGSHNHVSCDGVQLMWCIRWVTGPTGWVEYQLRDSNGEIMRDDVGDSRTTIVYGHVKFWEAWV